MLLYCNAFLFYTILYIIHLNYYYIIKLTLNLESLQFNSNVNALSSWLKITITIQIGYMAGMAVFFLHNNSTITVLNLQHVYNYTILLTTKLHFSFNHFILFYYWDFYTLIQHGLLASGGGTMDKTIRFWNTLTGQPLHHVDTGSQVPNFTQSSLFIFFCQHVVSMIAMDSWLNG